MSSPVVYYQVTTQEAASMTLRERLQARRSLEELRARVASARCAFCGGLACGFSHRDDRTWSRR